MQNVLIIFPDEWISYSPTIINLASSFRDKGDIVDIIATSNSKFNNCKISDINIKFVDTSNYFPELYSEICSYKLFKLFLLFKEIKKCKGKYDIVLGVDSIGYLAAKINFLETIFLSLEVQRDNYFKVCKIFGIKKIIIQTIERKEFLFPNEKIKYYILPNSPKYKEKEIITKEKKIIYFGNICRQHGIDSCIEALEYLDNEYKLELHGILNISTHKYIFVKYKEHIKSGRLILSDLYIPEEEIINYLSKYYIGLCFYDFTLIGENDFNYISCPSGKLYNYYAASLPVVGNDILGLESCKRFNCGKLLKNITAKEIAEAIINIERDYDIYIENCKMAAKKFDFSLHFEKIYADIVRR